MGMGFGGRTKEYEGRYLLSAFAIFGRFLAVVRLV